MSYYGDYTEAEEDAIDEDELGYIVTTEIGRQLNQNDGHRRNRRFRRLSSSSSSNTPSDKTAVTIRAPDGSNITRPLSERSAFSEQGTDVYSTDNPDSDSVATEEISSEDWCDYQSTISDGTIREDSDLVFEYEEDEVSSVSTVCDRRQGLLRPKCGWDTSSFASFGSIVPAGNNTLLFPQAPKTGRLYWNIATGGHHGHNAGVIDDEYLNRIEHVLAPRILSRETTQNARDILSKRPDLMPRYSNWSELTIQAWRKKFPDSSIYPEPAYQYARDPRFNTILPIDQFSADDIEWQRQRPLQNSFQHQRKQRPVATYGSNTDNQWTDEDMARVQNEAHVTQATNQIQDHMQPDTRLLNALAEFDSYVNFFIATGQTWQKPAGLTTYVSTCKNIAEQYAFERAMFLTKRNGPPIYYHPTWLQGDFRDNKGNFILKLNSAELSEMHESLVRFLSMPSFIRNFERTVQILR